MINDIGFEVRNGHVKDWMVKWVYEGLSYPISPPNPYFLFWEYSFQQLNWDFTYHFNFMFKLIVLYSLIHQSFVRSVHICPSFLTLSIGKVSFFVQDFHVCIGSLEKYNT